MGARNKVQRCVAPEQVAETDQDAATRLTAALYASMHLGGDPSYT